MAAPGVKTLRQVQIGKETTKGTAVAATEQLLAEVELDLSGYELFRNTHPIVVLAEHAGPTALLKKDVDARLTMNGATYQQLAWLLALAIDQPATTGAGPYTHTFDPGLAALWNPHSATLEARYDDGADQEDVEVEYFTGRTLRLTGEQNGALQAELDGFGRQVTDAAITSIAVPATLTPITIAQMKYYINDTWAAADLLAPVAGIVTPDVMSFSLEIDAGQFPWHGISGNTYFHSAKERQKNFRLSVRSLLNPAPASEGTAAERAHAQAQDLRFVTLGFTGPGNMTLYVALAGKHEAGDFLTVGEQDGLDVVEMTIVGHYDPTGAKLVKAVLINDDAAAL